MFTQMRTNLKFIGAILFTLLFFVGGFFMNTAKGEAATIMVKSFGVSYSLSSPVSNINKDGSVSTMVFVGCAPSSLDLYDVNTGRPCSNNVKTVLVGCAASSGDVFDVNTGIRCSDYIKPVLFGCALKSGDNYDINTGNRCKTTTLITLVTLPKTSTTAKVTPQSTTTTKTTVTSKAVEISPIASNTISTIPTDESQGGISGREKLKDSLTSSVAKVGAIVSGPMSIWIILLIILILLGGSYGIYSLLKKDKKWKVKDEGKKVVIEPVVRHNPATPTNTTPTHTNPTPATPATSPINTATLPNLNTPQ